MGAGGCLVAETQWQLKPEVSWVRFQVAGRPFSTSIYFHKVCEQGRDDIIVKTNIQNSFLASLSN